MSDALDAPRLRLDIGGGIGRLTLVRPQKKNALDRATARQLRQAVEECDADDQVRVLVLRGDGDDFCAGADLQALGAMLDAGPEAHQEDALDLGRVFLALRQCRKPVVAAVHGRALAGGAGLALAADLVVAREDAQFGFPEVRIGFVPAMVMTMLRRAVGEKRAFDLVATGRTIGAAEAERLGMVSRVVPAAHWGPELDRIVLQLASYSQEALAMTKGLLYALDGLGFREGIQRGAEVNAQARQTEGFRAGVRRFLEQE